MTIPPSDRVAWLRDILQRGLDPSHLVVEDESHLHVGHAGAASGGGHFRALIVAESFRGLNAVARQRAVYALLGDAMRSTIHALALRTLTPDEWNAEADGAAPPRR